MSAECHKCGSDIVYPAGTWPIGECPVCTVKEQRDRLLDFVDWVIAQGEPEARRTVTLEEILRHADAARGDVTRTTT